MSVVEYQGLVLNVFYNSERGLWSKHYEKCKFCNTTKYKHYKSGICSKCFNKLKSYVDVVNRQAVIPCDKEFAIEIDNYTFVSDGGKLEITCDRLTQQNLDLFDADICSE